MKDTHGNYLGGSIFLPPRKGKKYNLMRLDALIN